MALLLTDYSYDLIYVSRFTFHISNTVAFQLGPSQVEDTVEVMEEEEDVDALDTPYEVQETEPDQVYDKVHSLLHQSVPLILCHLFTLPPFMVTQTMYKFTAIIE